MTKRWNTTYSWTNVSRDSRRPHWTRFTSCAQFASSSFSTGKSTKPLRTNFARAAY